MFIWMLPVGMNFFAVCQLRVSYLYKKEDASTIIKSISPADLPRL